MRQLAKKDTKFIHKQKVGPLPPPPAYQSGIPSLYFVFHQSYYFSVDVNKNMLVMKLGVSLGLDQTYRYSILIKTQQKCIIGKHFDLRDFSTSFKFVQIE